MSRSSESILTSLESRLSKLEQVIGQSERYSLVDLLEIDSYASALSLFSNFKLTIRIDLMKDTKDILRERERTLVDILQQQPDIDILQLMVAHQSDKILVKLHPTEASNEVHNYEQTIDEAKRAISSLTALWESYQQDVGTFERSVLEMLNEQRDRIVRICQTYIQLTNQWITTRERLMRILLAHRRAIAKGSEVLSMLETVKDM
ncbi:hypothetical protein ACOME3_001568 [Neoechinorhynchus agilis]